MNTSDARDLFSDSPDDGWRPLSVQALAEDLRSTHPQITVLRFHAKGGMGAIYEGRLRDEKGGAISVAIKVLRPDAADDADYVRRFRREQDILASLGGHPNIVRHRLHGTTREGYPFLVMDWVQGRSLVEFTTDRPESKLTRQELLQIAEDLCSAVQHAHEHKVLHRDLKPQNIIVTDEGRAIVLDFGIARSLRPGNTFTQPGDSPGTLGYIAPEVQNGEKADERADIYSLGIILYLLLMKKLPAPFSAKPSEHSLDPRFDEIVKKAANPEREKRYASSEALRVALATMNRQATCTTHKELSIEYEDQWITINGVVFSSEPRIDELKQLLGEPEKIEHRRNGEWWSDTIYVWHSLGIAAKSPTTDSHLGQWPFLGPLYAKDVNKSRDQRVSVICCWIQPLSSRSGRHFFRSDSEEWRTVKPFSGRLVVSGVQITNQTKAADLMRLKQGEPLTLKHMYVLNSEKYPLMAESRLGNDDHGTLLQVIGDEQPEWDHRPIDNIGMQFEIWRQPADPMLKKVTLV